MKAIEPPYTERIQKPVYNAIVEHQDNSSTEIMRITREDELTRIDFVHYASAIYMNGVWVSIERETFIRPADTNQKLTMACAVNIPIAPKRHLYKSYRQCLYYTLYFQGLPDDVTVIDIIEKEAASPHNYFNFYGVTLEKIAREVIITPN